MRPFDPDTLVKPVNDDNDVNDVELDDDEDSDIDSDRDSDLSGDEPICLHTRCQRKTPESPSDDDTNDDDKRSYVTIEEPVAQDLERQSDSDYQLTVVQMVRMGVLIPTPSTGPKKISQREKTTC